MDFAEYRCRWSNTLTIVFPMAVMCGLCGYVALTGQIHNTAGWIFVTAFGLFTFAGFLYGIASMIIPRLRFTTDGYSCQNVGLPVLRVSWNEIVDVTIQNVSDRNTIDYRVVARLKDPSAFLSSQSTRTQSWIQSDPAWITGAVGFNTANIQISRLDLESEFRRRAPGDQVAPNPQLQAGTTVIRFSDAAPAAPTRGASLSLETTVRYGAKWTPVIVMCLISAGLVGMGIYILSTQRDPTGGWIYLGICVFLGVMLVGLSLVQAFNARLELEPEGFVYRGGFGPEFRVRWEDVGGVRVESTRQSGSAMVLVELRDWEKFLAGCSAQQRSSLAQRVRMYGNGIAVSTRLFSAKPQAIVSEIMRRAGLTAVDASVST